MESYGSSFPSTGSSKRQSAKLIYGDHSALLPNLDFLPYSFNWSYTPWWCPFEALYFLENKLNLLFHWWPVSSFPKPDYIPKSPPRPRLSQVRSRAPQHPPFILRRPYTIVGLFWCLACGLEEHASSRQGRFHQELLPFSAHAAQILKKDPDFLPSRSSNWSWLWTQETCRWECSCRQQLPPHAFHGFSNRSSCRKEDRLPLPPFLSRSLMSWPRLLPLALLMFFLSRLAFAWVPLE